MTRFTVSKSLFGDWSVFYTDPISGKQKSMLCNPDNIEAIKRLITGRILRDLTNHLFRNRVSAYNFLEKSNPHHISPKFRRAIRSLQEEVNAMYQHDDIKLLAGHISLRILPELFCKDVAPKQEKPEAARYYFLAKELENLTHEILNSDLTKLTTEMRTEKTAQLAL